MSTTTRTDDEDGLNFGPVCDPDQIADLEKTAQGWGISRRIVFVIAGKNRSELQDLVRNLAAEDEEALFEMLDGVRGLIENYQRSVELFSAVEARILVAAHDALMCPSID